MLNQFDLKFSVWPYLIYFCFLWCKIILTVDFHVTEKEGLNWCSTFRIYSDQKFTMGLIVSKYAQKIDFEEKKDKNIFTQVRFELGTFGMWSRSSNHYTMKTLMIFFQNFSWCISNVRIFWREIQMIKSCQIQVLITLE